MVLFPSTEKIYGTDLEEVPALPEPAALLIVSTTLRVCVLSETPHLSVPSQLISHSKFTDSAGMPVGSLYETRINNHGAYMLSIQGELDFYLFPGVIVCRAVPHTPEESVRAYFFSAALPLWFELRGQPALHAGTVAINGRGVSFLTQSGGGKSTLNAMLVAAGFPLVADDVTIFQRQPDGFISTPPGPRQLKMWPETAQRFVAHYETLPRVHPRSEKRAVPIGIEGFGQMATGTVPMRTLYLVERYTPTAPDDEAIQIMPLPPAMAVIELLKSSMLTWFPQALGLQGERIKFFGELVTQAAVKRLRYPSGWEHLERVKAAVIADT